MASNTKIAKWARATLLGPFLTCWGIVTLAAMALSTEAFTRIFTDAGITFDIDSWAMGMWLISFFAAAVAVCLIAVDVALLKAKIRRLPTGGRAWFSSMLAPVAVWLVWLVTPAADEVPLVVLVMAGGLWLGALIVRLLFGRRP